MVNILRKHQTCTYRVTQKFFDITTGGVRNFIWGYSLGGLGDGSPQWASATRPGIGGSGDEFTQKLKQFADTVCRF